MLHVSLFSSSGIILRLFYKMYLKRVADALAASVTQLITVYIQANRVADDLAS